MLPLNNNQEHSPFEVIAKVRGSTPGSASVIEQCVANDKLGPWRCLLGTCGMARIDPLVTSGQLNQVTHRFASKSDLGVNLLEAKWGQLSNLVRVSCGTAMEAAAIAGALRKWPTIEYAYVQPPPAPPPSAVDPGDDSLFFSQGYLRPAPDGIDVAVAWDHGGNGDGTTQLVDVEQGWNFLHDELIDRSIPVLTGMSTTAFGHGTAVLGIVAGADNTTGIIGVAPRLMRISVASQWQFGQANLRTTTAILSALTVLDPGDVLLLEAQTVSFSGGHLVPIETEPAVFDVIKQATDAGIIVIEAAGNGNTNLNDEKVLGARIFDKTSPAFRDSGAVLVGAATSPVPHRRYLTSNYGNRIDCFAWGENIATCGDGRNEVSATSLQSDFYTHTFGMTSGASAIIAGVAIVIQALAERLHGRKYSPTEIRSILASDSLGTPTAHVSDQIGVMPNLGLVVPHIQSNPPA